MCFFVLAPFVITCIAQFASNDNSPALLVLGRGLELVEQVVRQHLGDLPLSSGEDSFPTSLTMQDSRQEKEV